MYYPSIIYEIKKGYVVKPIIEEVVRQHDSGEPLNGEHGTLKRWWRTARAAAESKKSGMEQNNPREGISKAVSSTLDVFKKVEDVNQGEQDSYTHILVIDKAHLPEDGNQFLIGATVGIQWEDIVVKQTEPRRLRDALREPDSIPTQVQDIRKIKLFLYRLPYNALEDVGYPLENPPKPGDAEELCHIVVDVKRGTTNIGNIGLFNDLMGTVNGAVVDMNEMQPA